ncbi:MAG: PTS fructose transporter subunit IIA [Gemmatimonadota bacterium]|jgi:mannose/fructose-specific phosphotransferase system component IIA|nr:PTS fructose transporter subunit IIA [Gemmatimonadota bacterium]
MSDPVRGLVLAHASLAQAMISAARRISGADEEALAALTNEGCGPDSLLANVRAALGDAPAIVFTDLGSGSCAFAARRVLLDRPQTGLVCGVNLPILLDFVFHRDLPLQALVDRLVEKGRQGVSGACAPTEADADRTAAR